VNILPKGAILEVLPSGSEMTEKLNQIITKHFGSQMRILKSRQSCMTLQTCDSLAALRSVQEVAVELAQSIDKVKAGELADKALLTIKELLLDTIKALKEASNQSETIKSILSTIDILTIERAIRNADTTQIGFFVDTTRSLAFSVQMQIGEKWKEVVQKEGDKIVVTISHPFRWNSLKVWLNFQRYHSSFQGFGKNFSFVTPQKLFFPSFFAVFVLGIAQVDRRPTAEGLHVH
jgi:hypothetical protein